MEFCLPLLERYISHLEPLYFLFPWESPPPFISLNTRQTHHSHARYGLPLSILQASPQLYMDCSGWVSSCFFLKFGTSILAASLTLSIMTLPVIISTAEESLRSVPQSFRTVSISLGATRWQTIRRIVVKEALPGILTGVILGLERAAGETAPILFTGAAFFLPRLPHSPFDATMALPYHLFVISTQVPEMPIKIQYGTALVLLAFVLTMNLVATVIRSRARAKRQW